MNFDKKILTQFVQDSCKKIGWTKIIYAGMVGSSLVTSRNKDVDIIVITSMAQLIHL